MPTRTRTTGLAAAATLLVLTGCQSPSESHLAILAEEPTEPVPEYVDDADLERLAEDGWTEASRNLWIR